MTLKIGSIGDYVITFSLTGLLLYALQLLPNVIWLAIPPTNDVLKHNSSPHAALNLVEQFFGFATVALLIIVIRRAGTEGRNSPWLLLCAAFFLAGYYADGSCTTGETSRLVARRWHRCYATALLLLRCELDEGLSCAHSLRHLRRLPRCDHVDELRADEYTKAQCPTFMTSRSSSETFSTTSRRF